MTQLAYWTHNLGPFLFRFPEGFPIEGIRFYGVAYLIGFAAAVALLILYRHKDRSPLQKGEELDLLTYLLIGVVAGGRIGYVLLYDFPAFVQDPLLLFAVWKGGMASHGGMIGVILAVWLFSRRKKIGFLALTDLCATATPVGLFFGRLANFVNGELWGRPTTVFWAVIFPDSPRDPLTGEMVARHPSQLYQAFGEGLVLFAWLQWRFWRSPRLTTGQLSAEFLIGYGIIRFLTEWAREPDASLILGLTRGQFYSLPLILFGIGLILYTRQTDRKLLKPR
jgi:phosphatidylglycerol:prolipoprotein diacylglycerol transferase